MSGSNIFARALISATALTFSGQAIAGDPYFGPRPALIVNQGDVVDVDVTPVDPDGDPMTVTATGLPPGMTLETTTQNWIVDTIPVSGGVASPISIVAAPNGDLIVGEDLSGLISRITPNSGAKQVLNPGVTLSKPFGLALTATGAVLVGRGHTTNNQIYKVENGQTTVIAGSTQGVTDGASLQAQFVEVGGLSVLPDGTVLVAQQLSSDPLRLISPAGQVSTPRGAFGASARPQYTGIAATPTGKFRISTHKKTVIEVDPDNGFSETLIAGVTNQGGFVDGPLGTGLLAENYGIAVDPAGRTFVSEIKSIRMIDIDGTMTTIAGGPNSYGYADGSGSAVKLKYASGIVSPQVGLVYFADSANNKIRRMREFASEWAITGQYSGHNCGGSYQVLVTATDTNGDSATSSVNMTIPSQGPGCGPPPGGPSGTSTTGSGGSGSTGTGTGTGTGTVTPGATISRPSATPSGTGAVIPRPGVARPISRDAVRVQPEAQTSTDEAREPEDKAVAKPPR